jgi:hypothetical protein
MSVESDLNKWVEKKPIVLVALNCEGASYLSDNVVNDFKMTCAFKHSDFDEVILPTVCIIQAGEDDTECYLGVAYSKTAVSTFDTRLTFQKLNASSIKSFSEIYSKIENQRLRSHFREPELGKLIKLSPKVSQSIVTWLAQRAEDAEALSSVHSLLFKRKNLSDHRWSQSLAIRSAMSAFGLRLNDTPTTLVIKKDGDSELDYLGVSLYEDNVVHEDSRHFSDFSLTKSDVTGKAVFEKGNERLVVYTANKLPLEKMLGVDLIYINEIQGNTIMIQYKMLEPEKDKDGKTNDWIYRPDGQLQSELERMALPELAKEFSDYRLNRTPFYMKFVKRKVEDTTPQSYIISVDHLKQHLKTPAAKGSRGGIRISYERLGGTYLRETEMNSLIQSGYIGCHSAETDALHPIIAAVAQGHRSLVIAWQESMKKEAVS